MDATIAFENAGKNQNTINEDFNKNKGILQDVYQKLKSQVAKSRYYQKFIISCSFCLCEDMYVFVFTCVCECVHVCSCLCVHVCVCSCLCVHVFVFVCTYVCMCGMIDDF